MSENDFHGDDEDGFWEWLVSIYGEQADPAFFKEIIDQIKKLENPGYRR